MKNQEELIEDVTRLFNRFMRDGVRTAVSRVLYEMQEIVSEPEYKKLVLLTMINLITDLTLEEEKEKILQELKNRLN
jgi:hypothetical protein